MMWRLRMGPSMLKTLSCQLPPYSASMTKLEEEDPGVFSDGDDLVDKWIPRREWPDKTLPLKQAAPEPQAEQANQAFIDHLMQQHHMNARVLRVNGV